MAEAEATARAAPTRQLAETEARARRQTDAERADAKVVAMEDPDAEVFLEDGGGNGEGTTALDGEGEVPCARRNLTTPPARRPPNVRRQFHTPQVIRTDTQVENSQLQPNQLTMESEIESTASSPQPPLPIGSRSSSLPHILQFSCHVCWVG